MKFRLVILLLVTVLGNKIAVSNCFAIPAQSAATLSDLWDGQAIWVKDVDRIGSDFNFHYVSIVPRDRELFAYYIHNSTVADGKNQQGIGRARSTDGIHWTNDGHVLSAGRSEQVKTGKTPAWDDRLSSFPGAWKDGDTWYLVYEGAADDVALSTGDIGLATSKDGKTFVKNPNNPILRHEKIGWERANIGTPSLYKQRGTWYLFYHGYDWNVCQIGVASGTSLTKLTKFAGNPILPVSAGTSAWDTGTTGKRSSIVKEGVFYYMAFEGSTPKPFTLSKWSSGLARSANLTSGWVKSPRNPMLPQTARGMGNDGPEMLRLNDTWYLYVRTPGDMTERFRLEKKPNA